MLAVAAQEIMWAVRFGANETKSLPREPKHQKSYQVLRSSTLEAQHCIYVLERILQAL